MVATLPERLYYSEPHSSVKKCIELYKLDSNFKPIVEHLLACFFLILNLAASPLRTNFQRACWIETLQSKMVVPELPIPLSNMNATYHKNSPTKPMDTPVYDVAPKGLAGYQPVTKDTYEDSIVSRAKKVSPISTSEFKLARARANSMRYAEQAENMAATEVAAAQESSQSRFQIQWQVAVEAGAVLYSSTDGGISATTTCPGSLPYGHQQA